MQGVLLSALRLSEPLVWKTVKTKICSSICRVTVVEKDAADENQTLSAFLATSFNVELVYIILKSITKFSKELKAIKDGKIDQRNS